MVTAPTPKPKAWHNMTCSPVKRAARITTEIVLSTAFIAMAIWAVIAWPGLFLGAACTLAFFSGFVWLMEDDDCDDREIP